MNISEKRTETYSTVSCFLRGGEKRKENQKKTQTRNIGEKAKSKNALKMRFRSSWL